LTNLDPCLLRRYIYYIYAVILALQNHSVDIRGALILRLKHPRTLRRPNLCLSL
jgi:hypothetical protein